MPEPYLRRLATALIAALGLLAVAGPALATPLPAGGVTAPEVAAVLQAKGYAAEISKDSDGDPKIRSGAQGSHYSIYFYGCDHAATPRCTSIEFSVGYHIEGGLTPARINLWNRRNRFGRAYLDNTNDPFVEMDADFEHGATTEELGANVELWDAALSLFRRFLDCAKTPDGQGCDVYKPD